MPDLVPQPVLQWLARESLSLIAAEHLSGGCVASIRRLLLKTGSGKEQTLVLKQMPGAHAELLQAEAEGLQVLSLNDSRALKLPEILLLDDQFILMEDLAAGPPSAGFDQQLAEGLALQHQQQSRGFGFARDTFCGGTRQDNDWQDDGAVFYAQQRLLPLARLCMAKGVLQSHEYIQLENLCGLLSQLLPQQPAVLLHGDLWSGNLLCTADGQPALIDPAVYYGWAEAELAMTRMFGGFSEGFYEAYAEISGIDSQWRERSDLYNLYHYLNHLFLFGGAYHSDVMRIVKYYSG